MGRAPARGARVCVVGACVYEHVLSGAAADTYYHRCSLVVGAAPPCYAPIVVAIVLLSRCLISCSVKLPAPFAVRCLSKGNHPRTFSETLHARWIPPRPTAPSVFLALALLQHWKRGRRDPCLRFALTSPYHTTNTEIADLTRYFSHHTPEALSVSLTASSFCDDSRFNY
jgi:hypothetical protein